MRRASSGGRQMHSALRYTKSARSHRSGSGSLRRFASYHSGMAMESSQSERISMSSDNDPFFLDKHPARALRRRPGGNLRAVENVHDLEQPQRPHSTGSVSNRTHSVANSMIYTPDNECDSIAEPALASSAPLSAVAPVVPKKKQISLVETHSSQPNLRPSFEAEVAKLAALPDEDDEEGGIDAALAKLEGKYEKSSPSASSMSDSDRQAFAPKPLPEVYQPPVPQKVPGRKHGHKRFQGEAKPEHYAPAPPTSAVGGPPVRQVPRREGTSQTVVTARSVAESEDSYSSIPLLERGLSDAVPRKKQAGKLQKRPSAENGPLTNAAPETPPRSRGQTSNTALSQESSIEVVQETDSMKRIPKGSTVPRSPTTHESFLLDEDQDLSDLSSDVSDEVAIDSDNTDPEGVRSFYDDELPEPNVGGMLSHPLRHPPTPPVTKDDAVYRARTPQQLTQIHPGLPPTPGTLGSGHHLRPTRTNQTDEGMPPVPNERSRVPVARGGAHLPYILAYDAELLAQQFTVIEKDALDEIDWKELIELRWKQSSPKTTDWVDYLRTQDPEGVDVVIARFNLMVKWAVSEIVLTENMEERASTIVKYIRIAGHARRLRNYATMYQLALALLSNDCSRLERTWELVPSPEKQQLKELESLVSPLKNFHSLRLEMETATIEDGCIPFIGIYTRDLIYNAQKPAHIGPAPTDGGERLINFERHHTAASIVKNLLRLLEASSKYTFQPDPVVVSKCLWIAALSDDEIAARSRKLE